MYKYCAATYKYIFSGTGYSKGSGTACSGKYTSCTCASGYHWSVVLVYHIVTHVLVGIVHLVVE